MPKGVTFLNHLSQRLGYDIKSAYINYPFFITAKKSGLFHLTNHTLSTLLLLNRLENAIVTVHDIESEWDHFSRKYPGKRYTFYRILHRLSLLGLKRSDYIITDTEYVCKQLNLDFRFDKKKIFVIPLGVDHDVFRYSTQKYEEPQISSFQGPVILHVGTFAPRKNFENLLKAFAELIHFFPSASLIKVGKPNWPLEYERVGA